MFTLYILYVYSASQMQGSLTYSVPMYCRAVECIESVGKSFTYEMMMMS